MSLLLKMAIFKALCICCIASSISSSEETARDFIEHVLRIPNPDKVLNSVLGRLQKNRQQETEARRIFSEITEECEDDEKILPEYTESLQGSRARGIRQLGVQKHYPICHLERKIRKLNTNEFEYRPAYYEEVKCSSSSGDIVEDSNEICTSLGFSCVQWNKTIHLTRRRYTSDCWETRTMVIPAGCECMWPVHRLGDMSLHV
ncbi:hypothetical protein ACJJTC_000624 [Scirpophaga incertulas]